MINSNVALDLKAESGVPYWKARGADTWNPFKSGTDGVELKLLWENPDPFQYFLPGIIHIDDFYNAKYILVNILHSIDNHTIHQNIISIDSLLNGEYLLSGTTSQNTCTRKMIILYQDKQIKFEIGANHGIAYSNGYGIPLSIYICDKLIDNELIENGVTALVPKLTSNFGSDGGEAFCSDTYELLNYPAWKAFDGLYTEDNMWHSASNKTECYLGYKFNRPTCVKHFMIANRETGSHAPKEIVLMASNDGLKWEAVSKQFTNVNGAAMVNRYQIDNIKYFYYYRVDMLSSYTISLCVNELQFYGTQLL